MANLGASLIGIYHDYNNWVNSGAQGTWTPEAAKAINIQGFGVAVDVVGIGDFTAFKQSVTNVGLIIQHESAESNTVEGFILVSNLNRLATDPQVLGASPVYKAITYSVGVGQNEAENSLGVTTAKAANGNINGAGESIGVISDSVNEFTSPIYTNLPANQRTGLAQSQATGDLGAVTVVNDEADGQGSDEGRAILEEIHDLVPGAALSFASADSGTGGLLDFADNITALAGIGDKIIDDDIGFADEPAFQDSVISDRINGLINQGVVYLASAGNSGDGGYASNFRGVNATLAGVGAGRYMNFDPTGATQKLTLGLAVANNSGAPNYISLQFDQPIGGITSDVQLILLDNNGNVLGQSDTNPFADGSPYVTFTDANGAPLSITTGNYQVAVRVLGGPDPGHVFLYGFGEAEDAFDKSYGSAGGTYYPTTFGHNAGANTISVGAVPFWGTTPYETNSTVVSEPYSSFGPNITYYNFDGTAKAAPSLQLKPDVSGVDAVNTSFFIPGELFDTSQDQIAQYLTYGTNPETTFLTPKTATNDAQANLPIFTGTSAAAPNVAGIVALMKELSPGATQAQIRAALISSTTPLDGSAQGVWNPQGGYGLVHAQAALAAISTLQVASVSPGSATTVATVPNSITVTFTKPVNLGSLTAGSLQVVGPNGATVTVGAPIGVDSSTYATTVRFPIAITPAPGRVANGNYTVTVLTQFIRGQDGSSITGNYTTTFNLEQTTAPTVVATNVTGRIITITFNEAVNPATISPGSVYFFRAATPTSGLFAPGYVIVSNLPGATLSYNAATLTATINLSALPQSSLPTGHYAIGVSSAVTDTVGNPLNGQFSGVFPSGTNPAPASGATFIQDLGVLSVPTPIITSLVLAPYSDSGVPGDGDTNINRPSFIGQVSAAFPSTNIGLAVYVQFNGIAHPGLLAGGLNLSTGTGGRGVVGTYDAVVTTDANGAFVVNYPAGVTPLPEGQNLIRAVVVGQPDVAGQAGLSSSLTTTFDVDRTLPYIGTLNGTSPSSVVENGTINNLTTLTLQVVDPVNPSSRVSPFAVNAQTLANALNPATSNNLANYSLYLISSTGVFTDESAFIKNAAFTSTSNRVLTSDPFTGTITLTFAPGLPQGKYALFAKGLNTGNLSAITDAAGNPLTNSAANSASGAALPYILDFTLQPTATYITAYNAYSADSQGHPYGTLTQPRASYELPVAGSTTNPDGTPAAPIAFTLDFSNSLAAVNYTNAVILARSANSATALPDGDFGNFGTPAGLTNPTGFSKVAGYTVTLENSVPGAVLGQPGYNNRLTIRLPAGTPLAADYYRLYLPNVAGTSSAITDIFGSQLDGEFLGYQNASGKYVDQLDNGTVRGSGTFDTPDLSGDGLAGGAFVTGFVVVPNGNIIYANPNAIYNPQLPSTYPDGSAARPYPVLAPEATSTTLNGGDLNSVVNSGVNFNPIYDRSGLGTFQPSAFFAAQEKARLTQAPVVILAEPATPTRDPVTGIVSTRPFVLQAPTPGRGSFDPVVNDGSAAVPAMTTLVFEAGSTLKMENASLLVQNQGSALQIEGGPNPGQIVTVTSYKDSSVGGATNGDASQQPASGDYGGILFRNFNQAGDGGVGRSSLFPGQIPITGAFASDGRLKGPFTDPTSRTSQLDAISGADPVMSYVNFLLEKYAGGSIPQTVGTQYDGITLQNSRPTIVNSTITLSGSGSALAGLSADVDSLLQDDVASGPLLRNDSFVSDGLNGIYIRAEIASGVAEPSTATDLSAAPERYVLDDPYPYLLTSVLNVGSRLEVETTGSQTTSNDLLNIIPGSLVKFSAGAGINVGAAATSFDQFGTLTRFGSLNVGDSTYINEYEANNEVNPSTPGFKANSAALAQVLFTSLDDDAATTTYTNPLTGVVTTVVAPLPSVPGGAGALQPTAGNVPDAARWGGISIAPNTVAVINSAVFRYGGGTINTPAGTGTEHVLEIGGAVTTQGVTQFNEPGGARISVTNNTFTDNADVPINLAPDSLAAGDPTRPLLTGDPFIHGNTFVRNTYNAVGVQGGVLNQPLNESNVDLNSTWTGTDFTYLVRDTIIVGPVLDSFFPAADTPANSLTTELPASITLTLQSTLPGTVLADGTVVPAPGIPLVIKLLSTNSNSTPPTETDGVTPTPNRASSYAGGAGFIVGVDNGIDPPTPFESYIDNGGHSQLRILGIPGNQSTGQVRVPVTITSAFDTSVGTVSNGVTTTQIVTGNLRAPKAGDGGLIYFGGNSASPTDFEDSRSGNLIDNADIKYITRIEQQGGGFLYTQAFSSTSFSIPNDDPYDQKYGIVPGQTIFGATPPITIPPNYIDQYNQPSKLTIADSNLSTFSDGGVVAHPGFDALDIPLNYTSMTPYIRAFDGVPTQTFLVNDTISNMLVANGGRGTGAEVISETGDDGPMNGVVSSPSILIALNDTFYNNTVGINIVGQAADGMNPYSHVAALAMDDIFDQQLQYAFTGSGQLYGSESEYSLYYNDGNGNDVNTGVGIANNQPISGNPAFRDAPDGNFNLTANSAAIDKSRSELGPSIFGDVLYPSYTINPNNLNTLPVRNTIGDLTVSGGFSPPPTFLNTAIVTLPGEPIPQRGFPDQWVPTLNVAAPGTVVSAAALSSSTPGTPGDGYIYNQDPNTGAINTSFTSSTYSYTPIVGERDLLGNLRVANTGTPPGFGAQPIFDLGAYEYIIQNPPLVESVNAVSLTTGASTNLYVPGTVVGTNQYPASIRVGISQRLDPSSITPASVMLIGSGGTGSFTSTSDIDYNLANRLSFDNTTDTLIINTVGLFPSLAAANDEFELVLKGTGPAVLRNTDGLALDGNTNGGTAALPSGTDDFPGSDFTTTFTIDTSVPTVIPGSFFLATTSYKFATDTVAPANIGLPLVDKSEPTFVGSISDAFPLGNAIQGDQVFVDVSTTGDPNNFNLLGVATGTTNATGGFSVTATTPIPDTAFTVGPDGKQGSLDDTGATLARVRIVDKAGNTSLLTTDPISAYLAAKAVISFEVDTQAPKVTAVTPASGILVAPNANGTVTVTATFTKNIDPATLNASSVLVTRAGGTGVFTNGGVPVPIVAGSFAINYLGGGKGPVQVTFNLAGPLPNDFYQITLKGTGANPIRDVAGNALDGLGTGVAGSGDYTTGPITVFSPANARLIYVDGTNPATSATATLGSRENPYTTIAAGIAAANTGDVILVLPGTYREHITLKAQTRLLSAAPSSTDTAYTPGNPLATIIYGNTSGNQFFENTPGNIVVTGSNIGTVIGVPTEISGFTILDPLLGDNNTGTLDSTSVGISLSNSNVVIDRNYIVNGEVGVRINTSGANVYGPQIYDNVIAGNFAGIGLSDSGSTTSYAAPTGIINNTIADNTFGMYNQSARPGVIQANVFNNIFFNNHDLTTSRAGTGIFSQAANTLTVGANDFYGNGVSGAPSSNASGVFTVFNPAFLSARADGYGNILGNPAFVSARDPRPNADTPATFFVYGNFDLSATSAAINGAFQAAAPPTDILYRSPVQFNKGQNGAGPASIGAFYYAGTGGIGFTPGNGTTTPGGGTAGSSGSGSSSHTSAIPISTLTTVPGGDGDGDASTATASPAIGISAATTNAPTAGTAATGVSSATATRPFGVVNTSLDTSAMSGAAGTTPTISAPTSIEVDFSTAVNQSSVTAADLVVTGSGVSSTDPVHATGLSWVDDHTVRFLLAGGFNSTGSINVSIPAGAIEDINGDSIAAFAESFQLASDPSDAGTPATPAAAGAAATAVAAATTVALPIQPVAVAGPIAVHYNAKKHNAAKAHPARTQAAATGKGDKATESRKATAHAAREVATKATKHGKATK